MPYAAAEFADDKNQCSQGLAALSPQGIELFQNAHEHLAGLLPHLLHPQHHVQHDAAELRLVTAGLQRHQSQQHLEHPLKVLHQFVLVATEQVQAAADEFFFDTGTAGILDLLQQIRHGFLQGRRGRGDLQKTQGLQTNRDVPALQGF